MSLRHAAIVTAAGSSRRFNASSETNLKKEYLNLGSESVLAHAVRAFLDLPGLEALVVTYRQGELEKAKSALGDLASKVVFVQGGNTRQESVFNALRYLYDHKDELDISIVSIHDGARPFVTSALVLSCIEAARQYGGACPCIRVTDTMVRVADDGFVCGRVPREGVCTVQTPQTFRFPEIYDAHLNAKAGKSYTDDTEIFMDFGLKVRSVQGDASNRKVTYSTDLEEAR